jgi:hypothetical protein
MARLLRLLSLVMGRLQLLLAGDVWIMKRCRAYYSWHQVIDAEVGKENWRAIMFLWK